MKTARMVSAAACIALVGAYAAAQFSVDVQVGEGGVKVRTGNGDAHDHDHAGDHAHAAPEAALTSAVCVLIPTEGYDVRGVLELEQTPEGVHVTGKVTGLTPGKHGFHIHEFGDLRDPKGASLGGHYNPTGAPHGGPGTEHRHDGDLGNVTAGADGVATVDQMAKGLQLHFALGRSFVVHAGEDDLSTQPTGNSGDRAGVGVIGLVGPPAPAPAAAPAP